MVFIHRIWNDIRHIKQAWHLMFVQPVFLEDVHVESSFGSISFGNLKVSIADRLEELGFKHQHSSFAHSYIAGVEFWKRRNINLNRSVVLIKIDRPMELNSLVSFIHSIKIPLGKATGYLPFLNEVGMQVIVIGNNITDTVNTTKPVDTYSNQRAIIQSLFIVDKKNKKYYRSVTVMQTVSSKIQRRIDKAILSGLAEYKTRG
jgi:hypothetical protein